MLLLALRALARRARTPVGRPELLLALLLLLLSEAEQLSLGSASAAKVRRRRNTRGLQEAEQKLSMRLNKKRGCQLTAR